MSWIVEHLLKNRVSIRTESDIDSDEFNNLIVVERKIEDLRASDLLTDLDMLIIEAVGDGKPLKELEEVIGRDKITISKSFVQVCERIGFSLGGYFTDDGFLSNLRDTYNLTPNQVSHIISHMKGKFKHKLMKKELK